MPDGRAPPDIPPTLDRVPGPAAPPGPNIPLDPLGQGLPGLALQQGWWDKAAAAQAFQRNGPPRSLGRTFLPILRLYWQSSECPCCIGTGSPQRENDSHFHLRPQVASP